MRFGFLLSVCLSFVLCSTSRAGLHYSGEIINPLPARWPGFIMDHRTLRNLARKPTKKTSLTPLAKRYQAEVDKLSKLKKRNADQTADLGALYIRLGEVSKAVSVLRKGQQQHPRHFRISSNLATAWQLSGNLASAISSLQQALRTVPKQWKQAEEMHLKLLRLRQREPESAQSLDDLFGIRFQNDQGEYQPGKLGEAQKKAYPSNAVALAQQLALWLPADGRLLWLLAELAAVHGSIRTSAAMMDGCVTELGMRDRSLRLHRAKMRALAQKILKSPPASKDEHTRHAIPLKWESTRPLANLFFQLVLPPIREKGVNSAPWELITQTTVDRHYRPTLPKNAKQLEGKTVALEGFIQPLGKDVEMTSFLLIEYPVGCWYCEIPEIVAMIYVELPLDQSVRFTRELIRIEGKLKLNSTDPEDFLYTVQNAKVTRK